MRKPLRKRGYLPQTQIAKQKFEHFGRLQLVLLNAEMATDENQVQQRNASLNHSVLEL